MTELSEEIEQVRRREVLEGNLYDCPLGMHAGKIIKAGEVYCEGHLVGVGGLGVSVNCLDCRNYLSTGREKPHLKSK